MRHDLRICSLLPSATEIVFGLGLGDQLVAVTHECDFPPEAARLPVVTRSTLDHGTDNSRAIHQHISQALHGGSSIYMLDHELLERVDPDLILTQELCRVCAVSYDVVQQAVHRLAGTPAILSLEPTSLEGILETIRQVGESAGCQDRAARLVAELRDRIDRIATAVTGAAQRPTVLAMEWLDPPFTAGHWVPEMVRLADGRDDLAREGAPSFRIDWRQVAAYDPEVLVLMPCGFTLFRTIEELGRVPLPSEWRRLRAVRSGEVYAVNGSAYFNRPGPRVADGLQILAEILHPSLFPRAMPDDAWRRLDSDSLRR
jgi:iron complex transport system substrate-binding protein